MNSFIRTAPLVALALALQGCGTTEWAKPGADNNAVARDLEQCREVALRRAPPPVVRGADPRADTSGTFGTSPARASEERHVAEQEEVRRCMLQRGYELKRTS